MLLRIFMVHQQVKIAVLQQVPCCYVSPLDGRPLETQVRRLEKDIEALSMEKERLENLITSPDMYDQARKEELRQYQFEQARVGERVHQAEERWLELSTQLESLTADL